ncbi:MAG: 2OG-Fe(II) oxygenase [Planctomycetota bacterium]|nr:MAG: 2OG-Fe(II) oxygenase [Planctomycetota bacterium]
MEGQAASRFVRVVDGFYSEAQALRAVFDERFAETRSTRGDRFVWDYWHVPDQYTLLRTPAWEYFPAALYEAFHTHLVTWGRRTLGCWDVSPPWLSCYVEGCEQHLHSDVPHGPWAFVYSLTVGESFRGGETEILRPEVLDYWPRFLGAKERERASFTLRVPARFDRLVVFDPRFPHGVTRVSGTHDPREGRLVVHGWFTEPRVFAEGPLGDEALARVLDPAVERIGPAVADLGPFHGFLGVRLRIAPEGSATAEALANTLVCLEAPGGGEEEEVEARVLALLSELRFPAASEATEATLPLLFGE